MKCNAIEKPLMQEISIEQIFNLDLPLTNEKDGAVFAHKFKGDLVAMTTSLWSLSILTKDTITLFKQSKI